MTRKLTTVWYPSHLASVLRDLYYILLITSALQSASLPLDLPACTGIITVRVCVKNKHTKRYLVLYDRT